MNTPASIATIMAETLDGRPFRIGRVTIDPVSRDATWPDGERRLQPQVLKVLVALSSGRGEVVTRDELVDLCWESRVVSDDVINRSISLLRRFADRAGGFEIETIPRVGYRLIEEKPEASSLHNPRLMTAIAVVLLAIVGALFFAFPKSEPDRRPVAAVGGTVAVGEFQPIPNEPRLQSIAELTAEAVKRVFATNFIDTVEATPVLGADAADFEVQGTVSRRNEHVAISVTVTRSKSGHILWSTQLERPVGESAQLSNEVALWLADVLRCSNYTKARMKGAGSDRVLSRILRFCDVDRSIDCCDELVPVARELVDVAPEEAQAHAYLANSIAITQPEDRRAIYAEAEKTLGMDPNNGAVRLALGRVEDPEVSLADRERLFRQGDQLDPEYLWNKYNLASLLKFVGREEAARKYLSEFISEYPLSYLSRVELAYALAQAGDISEARDQFRRSYDTRPSRQAAASAIRAELLFGSPLRARDWLDDKRLDQVDTDCARFIIDALTASSRPSVYSIYDHCGQAFSSTSRDEWMSIARPEQVLAKFGYFDQALRALGRRKSKDYGFGGLRLMFEDEFAPIRAKPSFMRLMAQIGIAQYWLASDRWPDFCATEKLHYNCRKEANAAVAIVE